MSRLHFATAHWCCFKFLWKLLWLLRPVLSVHPSSWVFVPAHLGLSVVACRPILQVMPEWWYMLQFSTLMAFASNVTEWLVLRTELPSPMTQALIVRLLILLQASLAPAGSEMPYRLLWHLLAGSSSDSLLSFPTPSVHPPVSLVLQLDSSHCGYPRNPSSSTTPWFFSFLGFLCWGLRCFSTCQLALPRLHPSEQVLATTVIHSGRMPLR